MNQRQFFQPPVKSSSGSNIILIITIIAVIAVIAVIVYLKLKPLQKTL